MLQAECRHRGSSSFGCPVGFRLRGRFALSLSGRMRGPWEADSGGVPRPGGLGQHHRRLEDGPNNCGQILMLIFWRGHAGCFREACWKVRRRPRSFSARLALVGPVFA